MINNIINFAKKQGFIKIRIVNCDDKTFLMLALPYLTTTSKALKYFGMFACHDNYKYTKEKLKELRIYLASCYDVKANSLKIYCNSMTYNEKKLAEECGLGFYGKNSLIIIDGWGSFATISMLEIPINLKTDAKLVVSKICDSCNLCQQACPHGAIKGNFTLDRASCEQEWISSGLDNKKISMVYGCDKCQNCCPYNAKALNYYKENDSLASQSYWTNLDNWQGKNLDEIKDWLSESILRYSWLNKDQLLKTVKKLLNKEW